MISIKNLSVQLDNLKVLENISFDVKDNEFITTLGPNGCGKTTLLKAISGIINYKGDVLINNKPPKDSKIGFVFQSYSDSLLPWRTVIDNISFPLELKNISKEKRYNIVKSFLKNTILEKFIDYYPYQISGGMQQLTNIARALIFDPEVLLLDEPFSSLDEDVKKQAYTGLLKFLQHKKVTTILVTHNYEEAKILSKKIIKLSNRPAKIMEVIGNKK